MKFLGVFFVVLIAQIPLPSSSTLAGEATAQSTKDKVPNEENARSRDIKQLRGKAAYTVIREAIFGDRQQLLSYLGDRRSRVALCTPALKETYDLFQAALKQELEVLWDLDDNASRYGLSKKEHKDIKACIGKMEEYDDNFRAWKELNEAQ